MSNLLVKEPGQILDDLLKTLKSGLIDIGITNPDVSEGSDYYVLCEALSNELAVAEQNILIQADQLMPDTATEEYLDRILSIYGLSRRVASKSIGMITITTTTSTLVPTGTQLTHKLGGVYQVLVGGIYADQQEIPIESVTLGSAANLDVGEVLSFVATPAFAQSTVTVSKACTGAVDSEDDESARSRLLSKLQNPPSLGNWEQVAELCESFDSSIQKAFIYPAANGPSTLHIALTANPTDVSKTRQLSSTIVSDATSYIQGNLPEYVESVITTVTDVPVDISFKMVLPYPSGSLNLGTGGGWKDFSVFPTASTGYLTAIVASNVVSSTKFDIVVNDANPIPTVNLTNISWINKADNYKVVTAKIISYTYAALTKTYTLTIDTPFIGIVAGDYIFPACINAQKYVDAALAYFAMLGPGEKVNISTLLPRAYRKPRSNLSYSYYIDGGMLKAIIDSSSEVLSADYYYRSCGSSAPNLVTSISDAPNIYIPNNIGFYPSS